MGLFRDSEPGVAFSALGLKTPNHKGQTSPKSQIDMGLGWVLGAGLRLRGSGLT